MNELLREFAKYTPGALLRLIADGASAVLLIMPNLIGLITYTLLVGWLVEKVTSYIGSIWLRAHTRKLASNRQIQLGTPRARIVSQLPMVTQKLVQTWIGLPVLYVLSLILSPEREAVDELSRLVSGYHWQEAALAKLPLNTWLNFSHSSVLQVAISLLAAFFYANNSYVYFTNGFFLTKQIRAAGDLLWTIVSGSGGPYPTPRDVEAKLKGQGWTDEAVRSALWFLFFTNLRIARANPAYVQCTPRQYGLFRAAGSLGIIFALQKLHPLVAATKIYFEKKDIGKVRKNAALYHQHLMMLPPPIQANLKSLP